MHPTNVARNKMRSNAEIPVNGRCHEVKRCLALAALGGLIGTVVEAEIALMIESPALGIGAGAAFGTGCGALVGIRRMSPSLAAVPFVLATMLLITFNGTINSVIGGIIIGAFVAAVASVLPRAVAFCLFGALLGTAIAAIPCLSYGRPICEYLTGQRQVDFIVVMGITGLGIWFLLRRQSKTEVSKTGPGIDATIANDSDEPT